LREAVRRDRHGQCEAVVPQVGATVRFRIAVEDFVVASFAWGADHVAVVHDRREIDDGQQEVRPILGAPHQRDDRVVAVVAIDPLEAGGVEVALVECRLGGVNTIEILDELLQSLVQGLLEQVPVDAAVVVPLAVLADFATHEQ